MAENIQKNYEPILRALGYSLTSALIMIASLVVNLFGESNSSLLVGYEYFFFIAGLWMLSLPFFYIYACVYSYNGKKLEWEENKTIFILVCVISGLGAVLLFVLYSMYNTHRIKRDNPKFCVKSIQDLQDGI